MKFTWIEAPPAEGFLALYVGQREMGFVIQMKDKWCCNDTVDVTLDEYETREDAMRALELKISRR